MAMISAWVLMTFVSLAFAEEQKPEDDPFTFDYHRLRVGGLILAGVLCLIGITILFSGHCRCKFNQDKRRRTGSNAQQMLNDQDKGGKGREYLLSLSEMATYEAVARASEC